MRGNKWKINLKKKGIAGLLIACCLCCLYSFIKGRGEGEKASPGLSRQVGAFFNECMARAYFQIPAFLEDGETGAGLDKLTERLLARQFSLYGYVMADTEPDREKEDALMAELIRRQEGTDEDVKNIEEERLDYGEDALHIENSILKEIERENNLQKSEEEMGEESPATGGVFEEAAYPAYTYDWSEQWNYETLLSNFYAVDNSTFLREQYLGLDQLLHQDMSVNKEAEGPQILIYHTHASEAFADSIAGDSSTTIVGAGDKLAELLQDKYGFWVIHHTGVYDKERNGAYDASLPALEEILAENPTIEVVIDLHRDAVSGDRKLVMDLQGRPTARFMLFNGLSYSRKNGEISYLENPYIQENLALSFQVQVAANEYYPGIARKIYLKAYRYNMHLRQKSMLIELGAQNNTVEEIMNACDPLAHILAIVLD
ncbi:MAG: stage II sporulation protein P [Clostridium sp.]|nr:stage II sporulation protein P [Clostridium sp.]